MYLTTALKALFLISFVVGPGVASADVGIFGGLRDTIGGAIGKAGLKGKGHDVAAEKLIVQGRVDATHAAHRALMRARRIQRENSRRAVAANFAKQRTAANEQKDQQNATIRKYSSLMHAATDAAASMQQEETDALEQHIERVQGLSIASIGNAALPGVKEAVKKLNEEFQVGAKKRAAARQAHTAKLAALMKELDQAAKAKPAVKLEKPVEDLAAGEQLVSTSVEAAIKVEREKLLSKLRPALPAGPVLEAAEAHVKSAPVKLPWGQR